jgi:hypothetical protein
MILKEEEEALIMLHSRQETRGSQTGNSSKDLLSFLSSKRRE